MDARIKELCDVVRETSFSIHKHHILRLLRLFAAIQSQ